MKNEFSNNQTTSPQQVHLADYLNIIRKRKWVVITFLLVVVSVVSYKTHNTIPVYEAKTNIMVERKPSIIDDMKKIIGVDTGNIKTQIQILKSKSLASEVIEYAQLREYFANRPRKKPDFLTTTLNRVKRFIVTFLSRSGSDNIETKSIPLQEESKSEYTLKHKDWVVSYYLSNLTIIHVPDTGLISISFMDQSPEMAARLSDVHTRVFIRKNLQEQRLASQRALDWLKKQIREQKLKVEISRRKINEYKYNQLAKLSSDEKDIFLLPEITQDPVIQNLRGQLTRHRTNKIELAAKYGPKHPKIVEIETSIKKLEKELITEMEHVRSTIRAELDRTATIEKFAQQSRDIQHQAAGDLKEKIINYDMLKFEAESDEEIYDILLNQAKEISLTGNMETRNIRIVDEADIPRFPIKPNVLNNFLLSIVLGLGLGIGLTFFIEYMSKSEMTPEGTMRHLGIPVIGVLPYDKLLKGNKPFALPLSSSQNKQGKRGEYYAKYNISASLVTSLPLKRSRKAGQVFMVVSANANEGKSTVLAKSAVSLAKGGLRVVMVDADLQRPTLHKIFGLNNYEKGGLINARKSIQLHKILKGSLDEYSLDDLFSLIALNNQSGRLTITNGTQAMTAVFKNGHLFQLQSDEIPFENRLGTMLLRGGFITENQLKDALERNKRTKQPLGYILINAGYINQDKLRGPVKLQMEECIHKLFIWKEGTFVFEQGNIETYEDKRIYFQEDYLPLIKRLGRTTGSRFLEKEILSYVKSVDEPNLALLPSGMGDEYECESLLHYAVVTKIIDILKQHFDVVLVDAPPVLESMGRIKPLASLSDGIIFVLKSGSISTRKIKDATEYLKESKTKIIGTIINQVKTGGGYYYDRYYK